MIDAMLMIVGAVMGIGSFCWYVWGDWTEDD